jgi:hypothetical protein
MSVMLVLGPLMPAQLVIVPPLEPPSTTALTLCVLVCPSVIAAPSMGSVPLPLKLVKLVSVAVPVTAGFQARRASLSVMFWLHCACAGTNQ